MPGHHFLTSPELIRPDVSPELARAVAAEHFGMDGPVRELGSQQDRNFVVDAPSGRFVLKIANPAFSDEELDAQDAAMAHLERGGHDFVVPRLQPALDGDSVVRFEASGRVLRARLLTFLPGFPLAEHDHLAPVVVSRLGALAGGVAAGLADLRHPGLDRALQWDARNTRAVCELLAPFVPDTTRRESLLRAVEDSCDRLDARSADLRVQPVHGDVTDDNVVCVRGADGRPIPTGVIDFGDVGLGWVVGDLAATCASVLHHDPSRPLAVLPAVRAFAARFPLSEPEVAALWPAVVARTAVLVASGLHQGVIDPGNKYAMNAQDREWRMFSAAVALPPEVATAALREALDIPVRTTSIPYRSGGPLLPEIAGVDDVTVLDLSVTGEALRDGGWLEPGAEEAAAARALQQSPAAVTRYGEARLTRTRTDSREAPATVALGVEVFCGAGTPVRAPFGGVLTEVAGESCLLSGEGVDLRLSGVESSATVGARLVAGDQLGRVAGRTGSGSGRVFAQLCTVPGLRPPSFVRAEESRAWLSVCPDPSPLLRLTGVDPTVADDAPAAEVLALRRAALAGVQEHYYARPPRIERGWRHHLIDTEGRTYLDAVNNVAGVGHAHPRITRAAARQWDLLNTNSRFHYRALAEFSARLAALLPEPLDTVFFVNSGSEAVDLALRLAQTFTAREDIFCVAEAYHGWTIASDAISTSVADNPQALTTRPAWVHPLLAPNPFRGQFRGPDAGRRYIADARRALDDAVAAGALPAAFICEAIYGNAGGIELPDGYLPAVYEATRRAGGLCIADEVQVGYGRLGSSFWGFEQQDVVPDIVTMAKAMGNGHPLGAVITRRDVAATFASNGYFFSSAGGSPVSCAVGMAVLDVLEDERLQSNAAIVGAHLRTRFERLAQDIPLIGAVHGLGLYLGVELVRDRETLEPATEETAAICERLLDLGVILQPTGDRLNVLKIKPPLCLTRSSADFFVDTVTEVLQHGW